MDLVCCARAVSGHVATAIPASVMNSRRLMASSEAQGRNSLLEGIGLVRVKSRHALVLMNTVALGDMGHTVFEAYSGKEALEILRREDSIDLVVTDQAMPKMTGTELAKVIRSNGLTFPSCLQLVMQLWAQETKSAYPNCRSPICRATSLLQSFG
jgi:CheY-like chemotaxis protein